MSLTCPLHRSKGSDAHHRSRGSDAMHQADLGYYDGAEDPGYADHDMPNGDAAKSRNLDRSGVQHVQFTACHCCVLVSQPCVSA